MDEHFPVLRSPSDDERQNSNMAQYIRWLEAEGHGTMADYRALHAWSVADLEAFWASIWKYTNIVAHQPYDAVLAERSMPGAKWFTGATLNSPRTFFEKPCRATPTKSRWASIPNRERRPKSHTGRFCGTSGRFRSFCSIRVWRPVTEWPAVVTHGPEAVDRDAGHHESIGAIWSSASPDFGVNGILDRFGQIEPKVLIAVNGYTFTEARPFQPNSTK